MGEGYIEHGGERLIEVCLKEVLVGDVFPICRVFIIILRFTAKRYSNLNLTNEIR